MTTLSSQAYCTQCGAPGPADDAFCRQCGARKGDVVSLGQAPSGGGASGEKLTSPPPPPANWLERAMTRPSPSAGESAAGSFSTGDRLPSPAGAPYGPRSRQMQPSSHSPAPVLAAPPAFLPVKLTCNFCSMPIAPGSDRCTQCGGSRSLVASGTCFRCGAANPASNRYCGGCGRLLVANALSSQRPTTSALPVVGSIILPGLGQMMNGEAVKGFMLLGAALLMISTEPTILTPIYLLITAISAIDAALSQSRRERTTYRAQDCA